MDDKQNEVKDAEREEETGTIDAEVLCPFKRDVIRYGNAAFTDKGYRMNVEFGECDLWDCMAYIPPEKDRDENGKFIRGKCALCLKSD